MNGSIRKRGKTSWELRFNLPRGADGKRRRQHVNVSGSKAEAQRRLRQLLTRTEIGLPLDTAKISVHSFLDRWVNAHASRVRVRTIYGYRNVLRRYVIPALGSTRLTVLRPAEIEELYSELLKRGLSPKTVLQTHRILKKALKQAVRWNLIVRNPADLVDPPSVENREMPTLDAGQLTNLLETALGTTFGMAIYLGAFTGLRRGELAGLRWPDVDFDGAIVSVRREIVFVPGSGYLIQAPKSAKGRRAIDVTHNVLTELRRHRAAQMEKKLRAGGAWKDDGWVFTRPDGTYMNPNALTKAFKAIRQKLDLPPVRLHDLRHTHATLLLQAGVHLKVVQERLGHSTIAITADIYSHVTAGLQKVAAKSFESILAHRATQG